MIDAQRDLEPEIAGGGKSGTRPPFLVVAGAVILIVVIFLIMLLLSGVDRGGFGAAGRDGSKMIVPVSGLPPEKGTVSLWLDQGSAVTAVLDGAALVGVAIPEPS